MKIKLILSFLLLAGLTAACDSDSDNDAPNTLQLSFNNIEPLQNGFHFEGWAIVNGNALSTGKFNVDSNGELVDLSGNVIANGIFEVEEDISATSTFVLTIEPAGDTDAIPAATHHVSGDFSNGEASLNLAHPSALGSDFASATGTYILATPTDDDPNNENSGIWFLDNSSGSPQAGLSLPTLPDGWAYEGWAVYNGNAISTGTFTSVSGADASAPFSGSNPGPAYPGEDFVINAPAGISFPIDLAGGMAVISIEPVPDDSPAPYAFKPLAGGIPANATDRTAYSIPNNANTLATGTARIN